MSYPINYPTPQGANVQIFQAPNRSGSFNGVTWVKPQGASFVWFTLIGSGAKGDGATGGGSAAITNFMCPAFLIPNSLSIRVADGSQGGISSFVLYQQKNGAGYTLLYAEGGNANTGGAAMPANYFTAMGFFQSIAGQSGSAGDPTASSTTFLSGGGNAGPITANYGYGIAGAISAPGMFQLQPIIVGVGGAGNGKGGIGCGGGRTNLTPGGDGLVVIITW